MFLNPPLTTISKLALAVLLPAYFVWRLDALEWLGGALALAGLALAFGLSFGLGSRDFTRNILAGFYARKTFQMGEHLSVGEASGRLTAITPTQTILRQDDRIVAVANSVFLEQVVKQ